MNVIGIDLSGPRNIRDTCLVAFEERDQALYFEGAIEGAGDAQILERVAAIGRHAVIGIDAPLSYNPGGGDRESDRRLRRVISERGGGAGVMTPTMMRMVYLTLRGIALTRALETLGQKIDIVEVHPGASMLLRGAPAAIVRAFKTEPSARVHLCEWLDVQAIKGIPSSQDCSEHFVAACAAAQAAWSWARDRAAWKYPASPPEHPYDFAC